MGWMMAGQMCLSGRNGKLLISSICCIHHQIFLSAVFTRRYQRNGEYKNILKKKKKERKYKSGAPNL